MADHCFFLGTVRTGCLEVMCWGFLDFPGWNIMGNLGTLQLGTLQLGTLQLGTLQLGYLVYSVM